MQSAACAARIPWSRKFPPRRQPRRSRGGKRQPRRSRGGQRSALRSRAIFQLQVRRGGLLRLLVLLEDREDQAGPDDRQEPDELRLPDLLLPLVEAALEDADGQ